MRCFFFKMSSNNQGNVSFVGTDFGWEKGERRDRICAAMPKYGNNSAKEKRRRKYSRLTLKLVIAFNSLYEKSLLNKCLPLTQSKSFAYT